MLYCPFICLILVTKFGYLIRLVAGTMSLLELLQSIVLQQNDHMLTGKTWRVGHVGYLLTISPP